jgi:hypothetical protein
VPHRKLLTAVLLVTLSSRSFSTTVVAVITRDAIIVGSDAKITTTRGNGVLVDTESSEHKIELVAHDRIIVASSGLQEGPGYNFSAWIRSVGQSLPENISVTDFVAFLEAKSAAKFHDFDKRFLETGKLTAAPGDVCKEFLRYLVLGYENGTPQVYIVQFYIDWDRKHLVGPQIIHAHPSSGYRADFGMYAIGETGGINDLRNRHSYAYEESARRIPQTLARFLSNRDLNESQAVELIRTLIHVQEEVTPTIVGDIGKIFRLPVAGSGSTVPDRHNPGLTKTQGAAKK